MFHFMLPAVTLPIQYAPDFICGLVFLIYEMGGMRNEFGKKSRAFTEGRASPS